MARFKVTTLESGAREIQQVDPRKEKGLPPAGIATEETAGTLPPSPALQELVTGLYENDVAWAQDQIERLEDAGEIEKVRAMEVEHPKWDGGRKGVLEALEVRALEVTGEAAKGPPEAAEVEEAEDAEEAEQAAMDAEVMAAVEDAKDSEGPTPCPQCEFKAGSAAGLAAHIEAQHGGE